VLAYIEIDRFVKDFLFGNDAHTSVEQG
jgi:hypothetical protein